MSGLSKT